jgi:hypothetical protein
MDFYRELSSYEQQQNKTYDQFVPVSSQRQSLQSHRYALPGFAKGFVNFRTVHFEGNCYF